MKRFISFILCSVFFTVISYHNSVMAFWNSLNWTTWNHSVMQSQHEDCHDMTIDYCLSICCIDNDFWISNFSNLQSQNNKEKIDKFKFKSVEINFKQLPIYNWSLIWNLSPPIIFSEYKNHEYIYLIWIVKSNT